MPCPLGFLFLFFPSRFIPSYAKGETPLGRFAQGGGGPLPPPSVPGPTWSCPGGRRGDWDLDVPPPNPSWMPGPGRGTHGPRPPPQLGRAPILSPAGGRPLPCAVHSLSPPPHSEQPPPGEPPSPLHSRLLSLGCTIRVSPPGCGAALAPPGPFPLPKSPGPVGPPFPGVAGPPRSPLCPLHMPPAGRSLPGAVGDRHYLSTIRVLSIFKKMM